MAVIVQFPSGEVIDDRQTRLSVISEDGRAWIDEARSCTATTVSALIAAKHHTTGDDRDDIDLMIRSLTGMIARLERMRGEDPF